MPTGCILILCTNVQTLIILPAAILPSMDQHFKGTFRLFRVFEIDVLLHWSWFVVALIQIQFSQLFDNVFWHAATYLSLFGIVLLHEFGHALACRSVGGQANHIVLWPLGGVAFVRPPARPGAVLWSIAAGPLVNVVLIPVIAIACLLVIGWDPSKWDFAHLSDLHQMMLILFGINIVMLGFNMLPIYPLDGGQILQALLWFVLGRARSLRITTAIGLTAAVVGGAAALLLGDLWLVLIAAFVGWRSWNGYRAAGAMLLWEGNQ